jgi:hypothetical protein
MTLFGALAPLFLNVPFDHLGHYGPAVYAIIGVLIYSAITLLTFGPYKYATGRH